MGRVIAIDGPSEQAKHHIKDAAEMLGFEFLHRSALPGSSPASQEEGSDENSTDEDIKGAADKRNLKRSCIFE